ncbi:hypothetical protein I4U23_005308 [Adineta vaga]|nr:hypothetical protein I4U23_005308 [Adineta vaga]
MVLFISFGFRISATNTPFGWRITQFIINSSSLFVTFMLVCASIDRFFASPSLVSLRNLSNIRNAQRLIIIIAIVTLIYISPWCIIYYWNSTTNQCLQL